MSEPDLRRPTILVVDDDPDILDALAEILEVEGFTVRRARNGLEALEQLRPRPPDLVLLDLMMPVMDGWEFVQRLAERNIRPPLPIIVLSADRSVSQKAIELGAIGHLAKPFELQALLEMVRASLPVAAS